jgi:hypothetical protein
MINAFADVASANRVSVRTRSPNSRNPHRWPLPGPRFNAD